MKLANFYKVPPGGYRYKHPDSGLDMERHAWDLLRNDVTNHCAANGFPAVSDEEIQRQMCERMGDKIAAQYCEGDGKTVAGVDLGWRDILRGTQVMASFIMAGRPLVDHAEAERRANICSGCERNVDFAKPCGGICGELLDAVKAIVGSNGTSRDSDLKACSACKCSLQSKVWVPLDILKQSESDDLQEKYTDICWLKVKNL